MVLVGPSGCGKTTSLRMIAGLEEITDGQLRIGDRVVNDVAPKDRDIAMVFQSYALYPHMSVYDNLAFGLKLRKVAQGRDRQAGQARRPGSSSSSSSSTASPRSSPAASASASRSAGRSSASPRCSSWTSRCPTSTPSCASQTRAEIARLHQRLGTTMVYVTHDQVEAMTMGQRIAVMSDGLLQQVGTPQELYDHPVNRFVAGFIGSPSMNFVESRTAADGTGRRAPERRADRPDPGAHARTRRSAAGRQGRRGLPPGAPRAGRGRGPAATVKGTADVVEYLGNEELLHVTVERQGHRRDRRLVAPGEAGRRRHAPAAGRQAPHVRSGDRHDAQYRSAQIAPPDRITAAGPDAGRPSRGPSDARPPAKTARASSSKRSPPRALPRRSASTRSERADGTTGDARRRAATRARSRCSRSTTTTVLLVRQWRHPAGRALLEIPAGTLDIVARGVDRGPGRSPRGASSRRRPGYRAGSWRAADLVLDGARVRDRADAPVPRDRPAAGPRDDRLGPDEDERLNLVSMPWRVAVAMAEQGQIHDAKSLVGLLWLSRLRGQIEPQGESEARDRLS